MKTFLAAAIAAVVAVATYLTLTGPPSGGITEESADAPRVELTSSVPDGAVLLFAHGSAGPHFGRIAAEPLPLSDSPRLIAPLSCERLHYADGWGVCLVTDTTRLPVQHRVEIFDASFERRHTMRLTGIPVRARVAPGGRRAALTVFETGHSYADGNFSTRTTVIDTVAGRRLADLEEFAVQRDGRPFSSIDFNFWGLTFAADGDRFFATLMTRGERYLVEGSIDARRATVVRAGVECPSLSPDGTRVAFKKPIPRDGGWHLHVLDLASGVERPLNQHARSVDDQVDWFDEDHVVYHDAGPGGSGIWILPVDGVSPARLLLPQAYSPAVYR